MSNPSRVLPAAIALATATLTGACVTAPTWGDEPTRRDPLDFTGVASRRDATLRIQAFNHARGDFDTIRNFSGSASKVASSPDLYSWSMPGIRLADAYWVGTGATCESTGMANLRVQERNDDGSFSDLATFDAAGEDCLWDRIGDGEHPASAGRACKRTDPRIVLFAPPQCVRATTFDTTPAEVTIRVSDGARVFQANDRGTSDVTAGGFVRTTPVTATALVRDRDGAVSRVDLVGDTVVRCRTPEGLDSVIAQPVTATQTQVAREGVLTPIGLEASRTIDLVRLAATCPAGWTFQQVDVTVFATGANTTGQTRTSRTIRFTVR